MVFASIYLPVFKRSTAAMVPLTLDSEVVVFVVEFNLSSACFWRVNNSAVYFDVAKDLSTVIFSLMNLLIIAYLSCSDLVLSCNKFSHCAYMIIIFESL